MLNKKILMLCHRTPPYHGVSIMGDFVYNSLKNKNFIVKHVNISITKSVQRNRVLLARKIQLFVMVFANYLHELRYFNPNYIYITPTVSDSGFYRDLLILEFTRLYNFLFCKKNKIILHIHMRPYNANVFQKKYLFKILFRNTKVILLSELLLNDYDKKLFKIGQVVFLPNMISPITNKIEIQNSLTKYDFLENKLMTTPIYLTYLGHLIESKGYRRALEISKHLIEYNKNIIVNFYGEFGSNIDLLYFNNFIIKNKLQTNIYYNGVCNRSNIWPVFQKTHLMFFPTYTEAYPLTILEAISVGIPVVATNTGAVSEIINETSGITVKFTNSEISFINDFVFSIQELFKNWNRNRSLQTINYFNNNWSVDNFDTKLINIFN